MNARDHEERTANYLIHLVAINNDQIAIVDCILTPIVWFHGVANYYYGPDNLPG